MPFDRTDIKIMKMLISDARLSYRQIAKNIGISTGTVLTRIKNLQNEGMIKYHSTVFDHEKLGYELTVLMEITVAKGKLIQVEKKISRLSNVCAVYDITGLTDSMVIAKFKSRKELDDFVKSVLMMEYVERTNTHLVLNTVKEDFRLI